MTIEEEESRSEFESDDEHDMGLGDQISFSCIYSTRVAGASDEMIYINNCSNLNVIRDSDLALNIRKEMVATRISGSIPGTLSAQVSAELGDLGRDVMTQSFPEI